MNKLLTWGKAALSVLSMLSTSSVFTWLTLALVLAACAGAYHLSTTLTAERLAHNATRTELARVTDQRDQAIILAMRWKDATALCQRSATALQGQVQAAQTREAEAVRSASQRKAILSCAKPRPVTESEIMEVVDNATRERVCDYLNRPLP